MATQKDMAKRFSKRKCLLSYEIDYHVVRSDEFIFYCCITMTLFFIIGFLLFTRVADSLLGYSFDLFYPLNTREVCSGYDLASVGVVLHVQSNFPRGTVVSITNAGGLHRFTRHFLLVFFSWPISFHTAFLK